MPERLVAGELAGVDRQLDVADAFRSSVRLVVGLPRHRPA